MDQLGDDDQKQLNIEELSSETLSLKNTNDESDTEAAGPSIKRKPDEVDTDSDDETTKRKKTERDSEANSSDDSQFSTIETYVLQARTSDYEGILSNLRTIDVSVYQCITNLGLSMTVFAPFVDDDGVDEVPVHQSLNTVEINSDNSGDEEVYENDLNSEGTSGIPTRKFIDKSLISKWREALSSDNTTRTLKQLVEAFHAAVLFKTDLGDDWRCAYRVQDLETFNSVFTLCLENVVPVLRKQLKFDYNTMLLPIRSKRWSKVKNIIHLYTKEVIMFLRNLKNNSNTKSLLSHIHALLPFICCFNKKTHNCIKVLVHFWTTDKKKFRLMAFKSIMKIVICYNQSHYKTAVKMMYGGYVENSKLVSRFTLPRINFMRYCLVRLLLLDEQAAYAIGFVFIQESAIQLRNAAKRRTEESCQSVYNWQFINGIHLWTEVVSRTSQKSSLKDLVYPLTEVILGTLKLKPTEKHYPLMFKCYSFLTTLARTGIFIPVMYHIFDILLFIDFDENTGMEEPVDFTYMLICSKKLKKSDAFKDAVMFNALKALVENLLIELHEIPCTDSFVAAITHLKRILKKCKSVKYCRQLKQIISAVEDQKEFLNDERVNYSYFADSRALKKWREEVAAKRSPFLKFYEKWIPDNYPDQVKKLTENEEFIDALLPTSVLFHNPRHMYRLLDD